LGSGVEYGKILEHVHVQSMEGLTLYVIELNRQVSTLQKQIVIFTDTK
jgi:hypothetical protein